MNAKGRVFVIGMGYVGLPLSIELAKAGYLVIGFDILSEKVLCLRNGISHIEDAPSAEVKQLQAVGSLEFTDDPSRVNECSIVVIAVPTPLDDSNKPDLTPVVSACHSIMPFLSVGTLIINESTSFPGTLREIIFPIFQNSSIGGDLHFACSPERVNPGSAEFNFRNTPRLVAGLTKESTDRAHALYSSFVDNVITVSSPEVAELAKLLENTFRQVNIALVNQLVPYCEDLKVDIREVIDAAGSKPYGFMKFFPGAGVGGHCIPIDPLYLSWKAKQRGLTLSLIEVANQVNENAPIYAAKRLVSLAKLSRGSKVLLLGVAYKPGISDVRETPAFAIAQFFSLQGIEVFWSDPLVSSFDAGKDWDSAISVQGAIVITAQPGLEVVPSALDGVPILDCTGVYKGVKGVTQL